jgi:acetylornithine deacetylase/succinyl-diaminopimelate desuccinylase-like protein
MAITRMTVSPNVVRGGMKVNIIPDSCEAEVDVRVLPGQDRDYIFSELGSAFGDADVEMTQSNMPSFSSADTRPYKLILDTMKESLGGALILPCVSSGGTDSRHLRGLGIPCYGIGMMALNLDPEMRQSIHGRDEKIDIDSLRLKSEFLKKLAVKYLGD